MSYFEAQKAEKLSIEAVAQKQLEGDSLKGFERFLDFLKDEKISLPWKSINGFKMKYKGKNIGGISLGAPGWLDEAIHRKNHVHIDVSTADRNDFDCYLEGQSEEIVDLFMERVSNKCKHCRPTCGCSHASGRSIQVSGKLLQNVCVNAPNYSFDNSSEDMSEITMNSPCASYPPIPVRPVPLETVRKLIVARKEYIVKMLAAEK